MFELPCPGCGRAMYFEDHEDGEAFHCSQCRHPVVANRPADGRDYVASSATRQLSGTSIVQQPSRAAQSSGIAALVVGVLSFFVCWIPFLGVAVSGLGLLLGFGGLVLALVRRDSGVGYSIAGCGLSAISLVICLVWTLALSSTFAAVSNAGISKTPDGNLIHYETLKQTRRGDGKVILAVLVDEKATKQEVMKLAESLWAKGDLATLDVFDSRAVYEAGEWERREMRANPRIPEKEMARHWLAQGMPETTPNVRWVAEGRDH
jgi:hypothetical protein